MTRAEAVQVVWGVVARTLQGHLEARSALLAGTTEADSARLRGAAESVRRIAERLAKPKAWRRGGH